LDARNRIGEGGRNEQARAIHAELAKATFVEPVALGGAEEEAWADCDLASLAENRLGIAVEPRGFAAAERDDLRRRATTEGCWLPSQREYETCYWLVEGGQRVGTVALASSLLGTHLLRLSSLYVYPDRRRRGVGRRVLQALQTCLEPHGIGIRLETSWCWQAAVLFYLSAGYWVHGWKRDLTFRWEPDVPRPMLAIAGDYASVSVVAGNDRALIADARRDGEDLTWREGLLPADHPRAELINWEASSMLALWLALHAWPLVRSRELWQKLRHNDFGSPEALAYKIAIWEAWDNAHGFRVHTPRIPGLAYPTWEELEASWSTPHGDA
jgi:GNAT superfamily N-acetyltransferase